MTRCLTQPQRLKTCNACTPLHCVVAVTSLMSAVQIHAEFYTPMDFARFPWDKQDLLIEIRYVHNRGDTAGSVRLKLTVQKLNSNSGVWLHMLSVCAHLQTGQSRVLFLACR